jgi:hypothetical protein
VLQVISRGSRWNLSTTYKGRPEPANVFRHPRARSALENLEHRTSNSKDAI